MGCGVDKSIKYSLNLEKYNQESIAIKKLLNDTVSNTDGIL